jgi:hypothetical protein
VKAIGRPAQSSGYLATSDLNITKKKETLDLNTQAFSGIKTTRSRFPAAPDLKGTSRA